MNRNAIAYVCTMAQLFFLSINSYAQSGLTLSQLVSAVKEPYTELDGSYVSTGYLKDHALDLVRMSLLDGQELCDSNYVDVSTFCDLFRTMNYAIVNNTATEYNAEAISTAMTSSSTVKLGSAVFRYNYIREDAIAQGLIDYDANAVKLYDHYDGSVWCNPYAEDYVFMFSAGRHLVESNDVVFDLTNLTPYGNCSVSNMLIDFDNGADGCLLVPASAEMLEFNPGPQGLKLLVSQL